MKLENYNGGWILRGRDFPRHLQIAFGRYVFRLFHDKSDNLRGDLWLRDLPHNLKELAVMGYREALTAFNLERRSNGLDDI